jgi:hypothetical protein
MVQTIVGWPADWRIGTHSLMKRPELYLFHDKQ